MDFSCDSDLSDKSRIRRSAVAGRFYESDPVLLKRELEGYLAEAKPLQTGCTRFLVSPHAGFVFSGPVAACGFSALCRDTKTVFVIGPTHYVRFRGVSITEADFYETPLGMVKVDRCIAGKLRSSSLVNNIPQAHANEHSLEVQLPFLQVILNDFSIVPIVCGVADYCEIAELIDPFIGSHTAVIASSDLSHFHSSHVAKEIDRNSVETILSKNTNGEIDACGEIPVRVMMELARRRNLKPSLLDLRNSSETSPEYGASDRVVGYASIAFFPNNT